MVKSHCYWTHDGQEFEVHYVMDGEDIRDFSLYPKPDFKLTEKQEMEIVELIFEDARYD